MSDEWVKARAVGEALGIRPAAAPDHPRLVEVWSSAVDATHTFLVPEHRDDTPPRPDGCRPPWWV